MRFDGFQDFAKAREMLAIADRNAHRCEECAPFARSLRSLLDGVGDPQEIRALGFSAAYAMRGTDLSGSRLRSAVEDAFRTRTVRL